MKRESLLILRSTIAPGTTERVSRIISDSGKGILLAYCPERISEHQAFEELNTLPQIISGTSVEAEERARELFMKIGSQVVSMMPIEAELGKLFSNAWRYSKFAIANEFRMICDEFGVDYESVRQGISLNYPRAADLARSGFAAGPCLPKDTQQLVSRVALSLPVLRGALITNEDQPKYVRQQLKRIVGPQSCIGILGMAFKPRSDDIRDSLAYRLKKELESSFARVVCADPHVSPETDNCLISIDNLLEVADAVAIGCPHPEFANLDIGVPVIDIWGSKNWVPAEN